MTRHWQIGLIILTAVLAAGFLGLGMTRGPRYEERSLREWMAASVSSDFRERNRADMVLRRVGPEAVPALMRVLQVRESWANSAYFKLLSWVTVRPPRLAAAARVREQAALLLSRIGAPARPAIPLLVRALGDFDGDAAHAAHLALRRIGPAALPPLSAALEDPDPRLRRAAAELLGSRQDFGDIGPVAQAALVAALADPHPEVRAQAARSLGTIEPSTPAIVSALARKLADAVETVRLAALRALGELGPAARAATPAISACWQDPNPPVRIEAARTWWKVEHNAEAVLPLLIGALKAPEGHWQAALALAEMGPAADPAIPALLEVLREEVAHRPSRTPPSSALALGRMSAAAVPGLVMLLQHPKTAVRIGAVRALAGHGPDAEPAVPGLVALLDDPDLELRTVTCDTLATIGVGARPALPKLMEVAQESDEYLRASAMSAVNKVANRSANGSPSPPTTGANSAMVSENGLPRIQERKQVSLPNAALPRGARKPDFSF